MAVIPWSGGQGGADMGAAVAIRTDIEAAELRRLARREADGRVTSRLLALANVLDGMSREAAARAAGMDRQTLRLERSAFKGCTASTPRGWRACATGRAPAAPCG